MLSKDMASLKKELSEVNKKDIAELIARLEEIDNNIQFNQY